jgi:hypothetical protein
VAWVIFASSFLSVSKNAEFKQGYKSKSQPVFLCPMKMEGSNLYATLFVSVILLLPVSYDLLAWITTSAFGWLWSGTSVLWTVFATVGFFAIILIAVVLVVGQRLQVQQNH